MENLFLHRIQVPNELQNLFLTSCFTLHQTCKIFYTVLMFLKQKKTGQVIFCADSAFVLMTKKLRFF